MIAVETVVVHSCCMLLETKNFRMYYTKNCEYRLKLLPVFFIDYCTGNIFATRHTSTATSAAAAMYVALLLSIAGSRDSSSRSSGGSRKKSIGCGGDCTEKSCCCNTQEERQRWQGRQPDTKERKRERNTCVTSTSRYGDGDECDDFDDSNRIYQ